MKIVLIFGPPGVGKGTQSKLISEKLNFQHISTGHILREEIKSNSDLGKKVEHILKGNFASDEIMFQLIESYIKNNLEKNIILDGYPRTFNQAKDFIKILNKYKIENVKIISLTANENELMERLLLRAKKENRQDDTEEIIKNRFKIFDEETLPCINFFKEREFHFSEINGVGNIEQIHKNILNSLK